MRLRQLHLAAFGCFTDARLTLPPAPANLCLIYGPNEAGKSTTLRALSALFYGFEHRVDDDFLHPGNKLLIGAELEATDGTLATCQRRKGRGDTLLDATGQVLPAGWLTPYLGACTREIFEQTLRLNHPEILEGGAQLAEGKGDLGLSLFKAASGGSGLKPVLTALQAEFEAIYKPRGSVQELNKLLKRQHELEKTHREKLSQGRPEAYEALLARLKDLRDLLAEAERNLPAWRQEREGLVLRRKALDQAPRYQELQGALALLASVPELPADALAQFTAAERRLRTIQPRVSDLQRKTSELTQELAGLPEQYPVLDKAKQVKLAFGKLDEVRNARRDLPRIAAALAQRETEALAILRRYRPAAKDLSEASQLVVGPERRRLFETLRQQYDTGQATLSQVRRAMTDGQAELATLANDLAALPEPPPALETSAQLDALARQGDPEQDCRKLERQLERATNSAAQRQQALGLAELPAAACLTLAIPGASTVAAARQRASQLEQDERQMATRQRDLAAQASDLLGQRRRLEAAGQVPSDADLRTLRQQRDQTWAAIRHTWAQGLPASTLDPTLDALKPLPELFEQQLQAADRTADALRRESQRVAELASLAHEEHLLADKRLLAEQEATELRERRARLAAEWAAAWVPSGLAPRALDAMADWLPGLAQLQQELRNCLEQRQELSASQAAVNRRREQLSAALKSLVVAPLASTESWADGLARARAALVGRQKARQDWQSLSERHKGLELQVAKWQRQEAAELAAGAQWTLNWRLFWEPFALPALPSHGEAATILEQFALLAQWAGEVSERRERVALMERAIEEFHSLVATLAPMLDESTRELPPEEQVRRLDRLRETSERQQQTRLKLRRDLDERQRELLEAQAELTSAESELAGHLRLAGVQAPEAFRQQAERAGERRRMQQELAQVRSALRSLAGARDLDEFVGELLTLEPVALAGQVAELEDRLRLAEALRDQRQRELGVGEQELQQWEAATDILQVTSELQSVKAQIERLAGEYLRLRLASELLERFVKQDAEANKSVVLSAAERYFSRLTLGAFTRLLVEADGADKYTLQVQRPGPNGDIVPIRGLSDGTRDQLYLALRLAALERLLDAHPSLPPLVVDDIMVNFDDARTQATLGCLAELAQRSQILCFTHHRHLFDLARAAVPAERLALLELRQE